MKKFAVSMIVMQLAALVGVGDSPQDVGSLLNDCLLT